MSLSLLVLVSAGYAALATAYLEARRRREHPPSWARGTGPVLVLAHLVGLVLLGRVLGRSPFADWSQALSFVSFALVAVYVVLERTSKVASQGGGFYALAALLSAAAVPGLIHHPPHPLSPLPQQTSLSLHTGLALLSSAAVLASALLAASYLAAYHRVRVGRLAPDAPPGPSLKGLERLARLASLVGSVLLLPALVLGVVVARQRPQASAGSWILAATSGVLALVLFSAFWIWWRRPLRGPLAAWLALAGVLLLAVAVGVAHPFLVPGE